MPEDTTPEMVERVAKAICDGLGYDWDDASDPMTSSSGDDDTVYYRTLASLAIAALREPTEAMLEASCAMHDEQWQGVRKVGYRPGSADVAKPCFVAMIDAALSPKNDMVRG